MNAPSHHLLTLFPRFLIGQSRGRLLVKNVRSGGEAPAPEVRAYIGLRLSITASRMLRSVASLCTPGVEPEESSNAQYGTRGSLPIRLDIQPGSARVPAALRFCSVGERGAGVRVVRPGG